MSELRDCGGPKGARCWLWPSVGEIEEPGWLAFVGDGSISLVREDLVTRRRLSARGLGERSSCSSLRCRAEIMGERSGVREEIVDR